MTPQASLFASTSLSALMFDLASAEIDIDIDIDAASLDRAAPCDAATLPPSGPHSNENVGPESDLWLGSYWFGVRVGLLGFGVLIGRAVALALL